MRALTLVMIMLCASCGFPEQREVLGEASDRSAAAFATDVQPFIGPGCGSLDCHGNPGRPLPLHSYYGLRENEFRGLAVSPTELDNNIAAFAGMPVNRLLGKPLAVDAGGMHHVGGDLWKSVTAPEYVCLSAWLAGQAAPQACADAVDNAPY